MQTTHINISAITKKKNKLKFKDGQLVIQARGEHVVQQVKIDLQQSFLPCVMAYSMDEGLGVGNTSRGGWDE